VKERTSETIREKRGREREISVERERERELQRKERVYVRLCSLECKTENYFL
jgi:hypothetical protein